IISPSAAAATWSAGRAGAPFSWPQLRCGAGVVAFADRRIFQESGRLARSGHASRAAALLKSSVFWGSMNLIPLRLLLCAILVASIVPDQLSPAKQRWGESSVRYLMTRQERIDWAAVKSDADAKSFVDVFWARRDPTPETEPNELRQQIESRIAEADKRY